MTFLPHPRLASAGLILTTTLLLAACGGGGGDSNSVVTPVANASSAAVYSGPITGFGSVIVNGVRFDTVGAQIVDDDDNKELKLQDLSLGMTVAVEGEANDATKVGKALKLAMAHGTAGSITAIDMTNLTLTLLGQTVKTSATTVFKGVTSLAALRVGDVVEAQGTVQADNSLLATLIEKKAVPSTVRLMGRMSALDASAKTFQVGSLTVSFSAAIVTGVLGDGKLVKVKAAQGPVANVLAAASVKVADGAANGLPVTAGAVLTLKGVAGSAPVNGLLKVSGTPVDISNAVIEGGGTIAAGQVLQVKGTWNGTVLLATKVEREGDGSIRNELFGVVSSVSTTGSQTFVTVDGVKVNVTNATFEHGSVAQLIVGSYVEVKGFVQGDALVATKIELKGGSAAQGASHEHFGVISSFVSTSNFKVNGITVDASGAKFERGTAANLANGVYVELKGAQNAGGVFVATEVEIKKGD
jgi:hypothetical protein